MLFAIWSSNKSSQMSAVLPALASSLACSTTFLAVPILLRNESQGVPLWSAWSAATPRSLIASMWRELIVKACSSLL